MTLAIVTLGSILKLAVPYAAAALAWLEAHPSADAGLSLWLFVSIANKLQSNPANAQSPIVFLLRKAVDLISIFPHADAKGVIGGAASRYLAPGPAQALVNLLFSWWNIPIIAGSTPNAPVASPPSTASALSAVPPPSAGFATPRGLAIGAFVALCVGCAFLRSIKPAEIDCARDVESAVVQQLIPQVTLLLSSCGSSWPAALDVLVKDAGDGALCAVGVVIAALEQQAPGAADAGVPAPGAAAGDLGSPSAAKPPGAAALRAVVAAPDPSLALFCALAERNNAALPEQCAALTPAGRALGRAKAYVDAAPRKPVVQ